MLLDEINCKLCYHFVVTEGGYMEVLDLYKTQRTESRCSFLISNPLKLIAERINGIASSISKGMKSLQKSATSMLGRSVGLLKKLCNLALKVALIAQGALEKAAFFGMIGCYSSGLQGLVIGALTGSAVGALNASNNFKSPFD